MSWKSQKSSWSLGARSQHNFLCCVVCSRFKLCTFERVHMQSHSLDLGQQFESRKNCELNLVKCPARVDDIFSVAETLDRL